MIGAGVFKDEVIPVGVGIADLDVVKAQLPETCANLFTGNKCALFKHLAEQFTSIGDWVLEFEPLNGMLQLEIAV